MSSKLRGDQLAERMLGGEGALGSLGDGAARASCSGGHRKDFVGVDAGAGVRCGQAHGLFADVGSDVEDEVAVLKVERWIGDRGRP